MSWSFLSASLFSTLHMDGGECKHSIALHADADSSCAYLHTGQLLGLSQVKYFH